MNANTYISLKIADKSHYPLYAVDQWGSKKVILSAATEDQDKIELSFYMNSFENGPQLLTETTIHKSDISSDQWQELQLNLDLQKDQGLSITISLAGEELFHDNLLLEPPEEKYDFAEEATVSAARGKRSHPLVAGVLALAFSLLCLGAAYLLGDRISSPAPPGLSDTPFQEMNRL